MFFSPFLATRYLKPKRTFVSIITVISILGVALGVWLLTVVIAVFTGYGERIKETILGFEPHLVVDSGGIMRDWPEAYEKIKSLEGIDSVSPYVRGQVIMDFEGNRTAPMIRGILPPEGKELEHMTSKIVVPKEDDMILEGGEFSLDLDTAVVGDGMARNLGIQVGDVVLVYSPRDMDSLMRAIEEAEKAENEEDRKVNLNGLKQMTVPQELTITGIFDSGHWDFDSNIIFCHLETAQVLYNFDLSDAHGIAVRTDDGFKANKYKELIDAEIGEENGYRVLTWTEMHQLIFNAVAAERQAMYLILFMIMIVGGFCIMNTMITVTFQKRGEIGLMKALGARESQIAWLFLFQGMIVGIVGVGVGLLLAEFTIAYRNVAADFIGKNFGVDLFSEEVYKVAGGLPAKKTAKDLVTISVLAFVACSVASLVPALMAAYTQPAKALRSD